MEPQKIYFGSVSDFGKVSGSVSSSSSVSGSGSGSRPYLAVLFYKTQPFLMLEEALSPKQLSSNLDFLTFVFNVMLDPDPNPDPEPEPEPE